MSTTGVELNVLAVGEDETSSGVAVEEESTTDGAASEGLVSALEVTVAKGVASEGLIPALELTTDADGEKEEEAAEAAEELACLFAEGLAPLQVMEVVAPLVSWPSLASVES